MARLACFIATFCLFAPTSAVGAAPAKYTIKTAEAAPPEQIKEPLRKLLNAQSIQLLDAKGEVLAEVWLRKEIAAKAGADKAALNYRALPETSFLGAIRFPKGGSDYRQQKLKAGVYTMRLGFQPMDGNHMGTAPYNEFCLLVPADQDASPEPLKTGKELNKLSNKASGTDHPAVLLLFPNNKPAAAPELASKGDGHYVLNAKEEVLVGDAKAPLGIGLTLVGHAAE
jgi:hypothetical protein